ELALELRDLALELADLAQRLAVVHAALLAIGILRDRIEAEIDRRMRPRARPTHARIRRRIDELRPLRIAATARSLCVAVGARSLRIAARSRGRRDDRLALCAR